MRISAGVTPNGNGMLPWHVTYVTHANTYPKNEDSDPELEHGATAWAFTFVRPAGDGSLGVILPIAHKTWKEQRDLWATGGPAGLCAAVTYAGIILHELVHVVADSWDIDLNPGYRSPWSGTNDYGAIHESGDDIGDNVCWDEARMTYIMFIWAMAQRYPCLQAAGGACTRYTDELWRFAHSRSGV